MTEESEKQVRVSGPIKGYFIATVISPVEDRPGHFAARAKVCKTRPTVWDTQALIETGNTEPWPTENEAHLHAFRRAKQILDEIRG